MDIKRTAYCSLISLGLLAGAVADAASASKLNLGYLYFGTPEAYVRQVDAAGQALNRVSPTLFDLTPEGELKLASDITGLVEAMKARNVKVVPFLSNHWNRETGRQALANREKLSAAIAEAVVRYRLDGVNVDIENVTEQDRDAYTDLVRLLRQKLPAGAEVSVAVAANPAEWTKGWQASYDLAGLAVHSDYLMLMSYDEHWDGSPSPGPVASLPWVERSVQQALKHVPPEKLVLGIPFYGRYWRAEGGISGAGIPNRIAEALAKRYSVAPMYDEGAQSAFYQVTVRPEEADPPVVNYRKLEPGTYTVWYENERSIKAKLDLVARYGLKGTGSWALSQESPDTWKYYASWLNGTYFPDAAGHWAETAIRAAAQKGWMNGTGGLTFRPEESLTRAQAAAILSRVLRLSESEVTAASSTAFTDVPPGHWGRAEIERARRAGLVQGFADGTFAPERPVSREQLAAMLHRALEVTAGAGPAAPASAFKDIQPERWSWPAVSTLQGLGLLQGYADGTFRPDAPVKRSEAAVLLLRCESKWAVRTGAAAP